MLSLCAPVYMVDFCPCHNYLSLKKAVCSLSLDKKKNPFSLLLLSHISVYVCKKNKLREGEKEIVGGQEAIFVYIQVSCMAGDREQERSPPLFPGKQPQSCNAHQYPLLTAPLPVSISTVHRM